MATNDYQYILQLDQQRIHNERMADIYESRIGLQYGEDYVDNNTERVLANQGSGGYWTQDGTNMATKISIKQINGLEELLDNKNINERLERLEKKVFGDYQAQKIKNKTDGSLDFENDVALFFQHNLNFKEWEKIFNDMNISLSKQEINKISTNYLAPKKK